MHAYFVAAELMRVARAIVPLVVEQYADKNNGVYPWQVSENIVATAHMRPYDGCFLMVEGARGV